MQQRRQGQDNKCTKHYFSPGCVDVVFMSFENPIIGLLLMHIAFLCTLIQYREKIRISSRFWMFQETQGQTFYESNASVLQTVKDRHLTAAEAFKYGTKQY